MGSALKSDMSHQVIPSLTIIRYWSVFQVAVKNTLSKQRISLRIHHNGESIVFAAARKAEADNALSCCVLDAAVSNRPARKPHDPSAALVPASSFQMQGIPAGCQNPEKQKAPSVKTGLSA